MTDNTAHKVAAIKETQRAVEAAMAAVLAYLTSVAAPTAEAAHDSIEATLTAHGCESPDGHIVSSGRKSAEPHERGTGEIKPGTPIVIDIFPCSVATGYYADMSRTVCLGSAPAALRQMYEAVCEAQDLALSLLRPGAKGADIHHAVQEHFRTAGYQTGGTGKEFRYAYGFVHALGHGVGKEIHQDPILGAGRDSVLAEGDVITIEPGLYYPDLGGVRLEDMVLITTDGYELLTDFPRTLEILQV